MQATDGFAVASVVAAVIGCFPLSIPLGFISRSRIKRSGGTLGGGALATAGIVLGFILLGTTVAIVLAIAASDTDTTTTPASVSRDQQEAQAVIDRFERAADSRDGKEICTKVLHPDYSGTFSNCAAEWATPPMGRDRRKAQIFITQFNGGGDNATARVDEAGDSYLMLFRRHRGDWRISAIIE